MTDGKDGEPGDDKPTAAPPIPIDDEPLIERLAERPHRTMERLDPTGSEWGALSSYEREFYRTCVEDILWCAQRAYVEGW